MRSASACSVVFMVNKLMRLFLGLWVQVSLFDLKKRVLVRIVRFEGGRLPVGFAAPSSLITRNFGAG